MTNSMSPDSPGEPRTLEDYRFIVARLEQLKDRARRPRWAWKMEIESALDLAAILAPLRGVLKDAPSVEGNETSGQPSTSDTPSPAEQAFDSHTLAVVDTALRLVHAQPEPTLGDGLRLEIQNATEEAIWKTP